MGSCLFLQIRFSSLVSWEKLRLFQNLGARNLAGMGCQLMITGWSHFGGKSIY